MSHDRAAKDAALNAARYRLERAAAEPGPVDEYAQASGMPSVVEPKTPLQFYARDEAWEVANTVLDEAFARGDFDHLALAGQNIDHLTGNTDPDWWLKSMMNREQLSGLGPPALTLRVEDKAMQQTLDQLPTAKAVRDHLDDFNQRIVEARRQLLGGPPVVTALREVTAEVIAWQERRRQTPPTPPAVDPTPKRRWWQRKS